MIRDSTQVKPTSESILLHHTGMWRVCTHLKLCRPTSRTFLYFQLHSVVSTNKRTKFSATMNIKMPRKPVNLFVFSNPLEHNSFVQATNHQIHQHNKLFWGILPCWFVKIVIRVYAHSTLFLVLMIVMLSECLKDTELYCNNNKTRVYADHSNQYCTSEYRIPELKGILAIPFRTNGCPISS